MFRQICWSVVVVCLMVAGIAFAEKRNSTPDELRGVATHVVRGKVIAIYERQTTEFNFETTHFAAEVRVENCEKGEGVGKGDLIYIRYWRHTKWIGEGHPPPGTAGHSGLPKENDVVRIYLAKNANNDYAMSYDGGFNVVFRNGFETLDSNPQK